MTLLDLIHLEEMHKHIQASSSRRFWPENKSVAKEEVWYVAHHRPKFYVFHHKKLTFQAPAV